LAQFEQKDKVTVTWRSFQLNPNLKNEPDKKLVQSLAEQKGWTLAQAHQAFSHVTSMAETVGLTYNFDEVVVANSFDAHRFLHFAKTANKQDEAKEQLLQAYFTDGKNTADPTVLSELGATIGLEKQAILETLKTDEYADEVHEDIGLARQFGISGVPFFVFNRQMAVSGAQESGVFLRVLNQIEGEK
jgi:predicted DsbA family dithiol-disulfide isomerase